MEEVCFCRFVRSDSVNIWQQIILVTPQPNTLSSVPVLTTIHPTPPQHPTHLFLSSCSLGWAKCTSKCHLLSTSLLSLCLLTYTPLSSSSYSSSQNTPYPPHPFKVVLMLVHEELHPVTPLPLHSTNLHISTLYLSLFLYTSSPYFSTNVSITDTLRTHLHPLSPPCPHLRPWRAIWRCPLPLSINF